MRQYKKLYIQALSRETFLRHERISAMRELQERLLNETVAHYNLGNRADTGSGCVYEKDNGCRCAVGRLMTNEGIAMVRSENAMYDALEVILGLPDSESLFQEQWRPLMRYEGDSFQFLIDIQGLHDNPANWTPDGISEIGKENANRIRERFLS